MARKAKSIRITSASEKLAEALSQEAVKYIKPYVEQQRIEFYAQLIQKHAIDVASDFKHGTLYVDPDMKREFSWDVFIQSKFIESLWLRLPIPPIIAVESTPGKLQIIDGFHRTYTLVKYFDNEFIPRGIIEPIANKKFKNLPDQAKLRLQQAPVPIQVITIIKRDPSIPDVEFERLKVMTIYDLFRRVNVCLVRLKFSQLLFCGVQTPAIKMIKEVAQLEDYRQLIGELKDTEKKAFLDKMLLLDVGVCLYKDKLVNILGTGRMRKHGEIGDFIFSTDTKRLEQVKKELVTLISIARRVGLRREDFILQTYGSKTQTKLSQTLFLTTMWALKEVKDAKGEEKLVKAGEKVRNAIRDYFKSVLTSEDKKVIFRQASHHGKQEALEVLVRGLAEQISKVVG